MSIALTIIGILLAVVIVLCAVIYAMREARKDDDIDNTLEFWRWPPL
jgi:hypothetical protein